MSTADTHKPRPCQKSLGRFPVLVVAGGFAAILAGSQLLSACGKGASEVRTVIDETLNMDAGNYVARGFDLPKDCSMHLAFEVREGRGIDIFVVTEAQRLEFEKAPLKPWSSNPPRPTDALFSGKAWFYWTKISAGDQLSRYQGSLMLPPGRWSFIARSIQPDPSAEKAGAAKVYVKISIH